MSAGSGKLPKTLERVMRSSRRVNVDTLEYYEGVDLTPAEAHRVLDEHGVSDYYQFWDEVSISMSAVVTKQLTFLSGLDTNKGKTMTNYSRT
jgi:hypothetical protein